MTYFSPDYFTARSRWRSAATRLGYRLESHEIEAVAPIDNHLTIDVAMCGNPLAHQALVISSGLHGAEGLFGAAVQLALLEQYLPDYQLPKDLAIVIIHILNPFGCAWTRRWNEDNIDLNRNFLLADESYAGCPIAYPQLDSFLNPQSPPSRLEPFLLKSLGLINRYGMSTLKDTLPIGQYEFPQGLFFGGKAPSQTQKILTAHLPRWLGLARRVIHLDLHSGLGQWGKYQLFAEMTSTNPRYQWLQQNLGGDRLLSLDPDHLVYQPRGTFGQWCQATFTDRQYDFLLAEFGTYSMLRVLKALRAENRAHWWGQPEDKSSQWAKQELLEVFVPQDPQWRKMAVQQAIDLCLNSMTALG
jgi:Protein of unknown function (DUF2817)